MPVVALFLPRTAVHLDEIWNHLQDDRLELSISKGSLKRSNTAITFTTVENGVTTLCVYLLPGLLVVKRNGSYPGKDSLPTVARNIYSSFLTMWPGVAHNIRTDKLDFGYQHSSDSAALKTLFLPAFRDFIHGAVEPIRRGRAPPTELSEEFQTASEVTQRIRQAIMSIRLFSSLSKDDLQSEVRIALNEARFARAFARVRESRAEFRLQSRTTRANIEIQKSLNRLTILLVILTIVLVGMTGLTMFGGF